MAYPARPDDGVNQRTLTFGYGGTGSIDDALGRIVEIEDSDLGDIVVAAYEYMGTGRGG